jgi:hypothetical protein
MPRNQFRQLHRDGAVDRQFAGKTNAVISNKVICRVRLEAPISHHHYRTGRVFSVPIKKTSLIIANDGCQQIPTVRIRSSSTKPNKLA